MSWCTVFYLALISLWWNMILSTWLSISKLTFLPSLSFPCDDVTGEFVKRNRWIFEKYPVWFHWCLMFRSPLAKIFFLAEPRIRTNNVSLFIANALSQPILLQKILQVLAYPIFSDSLPSLISWSITLKIGTDQKNSIILYS